MYHIVIDLLCIIMQPRARGAAIFRDFRGAGDDALPQGEEVGLQGGGVDSGARPA